MPIFILPALVAIFASPTMATDTVLFTMIGTTAVQTSFAHLVVDLNISRLYTAYDRLNDMVAAVARQNSFNTKRQLQR